MNVVNKIFKRKIFIFLQKRPKVYQIGLKNVNVKCVKDTCEPQMMFPLEEKPFLMILSWNQRHAQHQMESFLSFRVPDSTTSSKIASNAL